MIDLMTSIQISLTENSSLSDFVNYESQNWTTYTRNDVWSGVESGGLILRESKSILKHFSSISNVDEDNHIDDDTASSNQPEWQRVELLEILYFELFIF